MQMCAVMFYRAQFFQQSKTVRARRSGQKKHLIVGRPWQTCAVGMVRQFQETENGNRWILVLTDHFACWCVAPSTPDANTEAVARILDEGVFSYFGIQKIFTLTKERYLRVMSARSAAEYGGHTKCGQLCMHLQTMECVKEETKL